MTLNKKILTVFSLVLLFLGLCVGCTNKDKSVEEPEETMSLSANDTTQVIDLMHQYFDLLLNKDFDGAMSMISQLHNDSLLEMTPELQKHYQMGMKIISPVRYDFVQVHIGLCTAPCLPDCQRELLVQFPFQDLVAD